MSSKNKFNAILATAIAISLLSGCGFRRKKYENPITNDTSQPDKKLFDNAIVDLEKGRYDIARLKLNTLMNTYDTSEYLAKAKLAVADSWEREGGAGARAQAIAEYKDFRLFYPLMEEAAEAQEKICLIYYNLMMKPDRDSTQAQMANEECKTLLEQYPNSKFAPRTEQRIREIQEVLARGEFGVGSQYFKRGNFIAAANRLETSALHYPLFSQADESWWMVAQSYEKLGNAFRDRSANAYAQILRNYPLSPFADLAKKELARMEREIPEADPTALAHMKFEIENRTKTGMMHSFWGMFKTMPDMTMAAKSGTPSLAIFKPGIPVSVPGSTPELTGGPTPPTGTTGVSDVTIAPVTGGSALDNQPDARQNQQRPPQQ